jgi:PAS domain-containing protein
MKPYKPLTSRKMSFAEDLIENLPIGLMILDQDGRVLRMNRKQEETSRIPRKNILGKTFAETFPKTMEQGLKKHYANLLKKGTPFNFVIDRYIPQYNPEQMTYRARGARFSSGRYFILTTGRESIMKSGLSKPGQTSCSPKISSHDRILPNIVISPI